VVNKGVTVNLNDTVLIDRLALWTVDTDETPEAFESRIVDTIEGRADTFRLSVLALDD